MHKVCVRVEVISFGRFNVSCRVSRWLRRRAESLRTANFFGLTRGVETAHLIRASLESIAYQIRDVIEVMRGHQEFQIETLMVDGGPTRNDWLMQFQADLLQTPVARSDMAELSAMGAAALAWKAHSALPLRDIEQLLPDHEYFYPDSSKATEYAEFYAGWKRAVEHLLYENR